MRKNSNQLTMTLIVSTVVCCSYNDSVSSSDKMSIASYRGMNNELERMGKVALVACFKIHPEICLQELRKSTEIFSHH
jgi:hypothetical protein